MGRRERMEMNACEPVFTGVGSMKWYLQRKGWRLEGKLGPCGSRTPWMDRDRRENI